MAAAWARLRRALERLRRCGQPGALGPLGSPWPGRLGRFPNGDFHRATRYLNVDFFRVGIWGGGGACF